MDRDSEIQRIMVEYKVNKVHATQIYLGLRKPPGVIIQPVKSDDSAKGQQSKQKISNENVNVKKHKQHFEALIQVEKQSKERQQYRWQKKGVMGKKSSFQLSKSNDTELMTSQDTEDRSQLSISGEEKESMLPLKSDLSEVMESTPIKNEVVETIEEDIEELITAVHQFNENDHQEQQFSVISVKPLPAPQLRTKVSTFEPAIALQKSKQSNNLSIVKDVSHDKGCDLCFSHPLETTDDQNPLIQFRCNCQMHFVCMFRALQSLESEENQNKSNDEQKSITLSNLSESKDNEQESEIKEHKEVFKCPNSAVCHGIITWQDIEEFREYSRDLMGYYGDSTIQHSKFLHCPTCDCAHAKIPKGITTCQAICAENSQHRFCRFCFAEWTINHDCQNKIYEASAEREEEAEIKFPAMIEAAAAEEVKVEEVEEEIELTPLILPELTEQELTISYPNGVIQATEQFDLAFILGAEQFKRKFRAFKAVSQMNPDYYHVGQYSANTSTVYTTEMAIAESHYIDGKPSHLTAEKEEEDTAVNRIRMFQLNQGDDVVKTMDLPICKICYDDIEPNVVTSLKLACNCTVHYDCLVGYLKNCLGDKSTFLRGKFGVHCHGWIMNDASSCQECFDVTSAVDLYHYCVWNNEGKPDHRGGTSDDEDRNKEYRLKLIGWEVEHVKKFERYAFVGDDYIACPQCCTVHFDANRYLTGKIKKASCRYCKPEFSFCVKCCIPWPSTGLHQCSEGNTEKNKEKEQKDSEEALSELFLRITTKCCPKKEENSGKCSCLTRITHYHGHGCHHITCPMCKTGFCYVCESSGPENLKARGTQSKCKCVSSASWSTFCKTEKIKEHIVNEPYPHDDRCGCCICPDCRPNKPCHDCHGNCVVCRGEVPPGPSMIHWQREKNLATRLETMAEDESATAVRSRLIEEFRREPIHRPRNLNDVDYTPTPPLRRFLLEQEQVRSYQQRLQARQTNSHFLAATTRATNTLSNERNTVQTSRTGPSSSSTTMKTNTRTAPTSNQGCTCLLM